MKSQHLTCWSHTAVLGGIRYVPTSRCTETVMENEATILVKVNLAEERWPSDAKNNLKASQCYHIIQCKIKWWGEMTPLALWLSGQKQCTALPSKKLIFRETICLISCQKGSFKSSLLGFRNKALELTLNMTENKTALTSLQTFVTGSTDK